MWKYIIWKTVLSVITLFLTIFVFYMIYVSIKPDPFFALNKDDKLSAHQSNPEILWSPIKRFWYWFTGIFSNNWGKVYTLVASQTIPKIYFKPYWNSMLVSIPGFFFGMFLGLILGGLAGYRRGTLIDRAINLFVTFFIAIPTFILAAFALLIGPVVGLPTMFESGAGTSYMIKTLILPILINTVTSLAAWAKIMRFEISNILVTDYILAARTKGYSEFFIFRNYVLRNAFYPFIGQFVTSFMVIFSSSIIIEQFFNIGGTSTLLNEANSAGEINIIIFQMFFLLTTGIFLQVIVDVAQFMINPLVKANFSSKTSPFTKIKFMIIRAKRSKKEKLKLANNKNK